VNKLTISAARLAKLRRICLALAGAVEVEAWGDPTWRVSNRIFAMQKGNYAGGRPSVWVKAPPGDQDARIEEDPKLYFAPPYVGSKGWLGVYLDGAAIDWRPLGELIEESYALISRKRSSRPRARTSKSASTRPARRSGSRSGL
jgi:predicted DNA-binding protein (MmcQ/YjbR family)